MQTIIFTNIIKGCQKRFYYINNHKELFLFYIYTSSLLYSDIVKVNIKDCRHSTLIIKCKKIIVL